MHRDPFSHNPPRRVEPSDRARQAQEKWMASQGGEESVKRRMVAGQVPSAGYLDELVATWQQAMHARGPARLAAALRDVQAAQLRRARRQLRLALVLCGLAVGCTLALVAWFVILGNH